MGTRLPLLGSGPPLAGCPSQTPPGGTSAVGTEQWASQRKGCQSCELLWSVWSLSILSPAKQKNRQLAWGSSMVSVFKEGMMSYSASCMRILDGCVCVHLLYDLSQERQEFKILALSLNGLGSSSLC